MNYKKFKLLLADYFYNEIVKHKAKRYDYVNFCIDHCESSEHALLSSIILSGIVYNDEEYFCSNTFKLHSELLNIPHNLIIRDINVIRNKL